MSRPDSGEGFTVMDVSTAILDDEKFQQLALQAPELYDAALVGFMAALSRSWKKGRRVSVHDAWPKYRPVNAAAIEELIKVKLLDAKGCIPVGSWRTQLRAPLMRRQRLAMLRGFDREAVVLAFDGRCAYCGRRDGPMEIDHRTPVSKGGSNDRQNLVLACRSCNQAKRDGDPADWPVLYPARSA